MNPQDPNQQNPQNQPYQPNGQYQQNQQVPGQQQPIGQPGYNTQDDQPQVVYMARPLEPQHQQVSPEMQQRHEESKRKYPKLNLSKGEYIISEVRRHPIGLVSIWGVVGIVVIALVAVVAFLASMSGSSDVQSVAIPVMYLAIPALLVSMLVMLFGFVSTFIYQANRFFLTNESVIQHIQVSLFSQREQTVSLANVEDASFSQDGILPHLFDYGMIRLSTQGDETTYRFTYASNPKKQIALLNNAVENFKNVRPIEH